jgi:YggT family protein
VAERATKLMLLTAAFTSQDIANYVGELFNVYIILILIYVLANLVLSFGARPPYSRAFDVIMGFLRDVSEPWLRIFRKVLPQFGGLDISPMVAILTLYLLGDLITNLIQG